MEIGVNAAERRRYRNQGLGVINDPHAIYDAMRAEGDIHPGGVPSQFGLEDPLGAAYSDAPRFTAVGFDVAEEIFRSPEIFSNGTYEASTRIWGPNVMAMDGQEHRRYRALVQPAFAARAMKNWESRWLSPYLDELIDSFSAEQRVDLYMRYCARFPAHTIASGLGIPHDEVSEIHDLIVRTAGFLPPPDDAAAAAARFKERMTTIIRERRTEAYDDLIGFLVESEISENSGQSHELSDEEIFGFAAFLLTAGSGTTYRMTGIMLATLLTRPEILSMVVADHSLLPQVVEEGLRWEPPNGYFPRLAIRDVEIGGKVLPAGSVVDVAVNAANRDSRRWSNPHEFDPFRPRLPHLTFASGPHFCIGNQLARMEVRVALGRLLERFPDMQLDGEQPTPFVTGCHYRMPTAAPVILSRGQ
jgi:cytochrome P450